MYDLDVCLRLATWRFWKSLGDERKEMTLEDGTPEKGCRQGDATGEGEGIHILWFLFKVLTSVISYVSKTNFSCHLQPLGWRFADATCPLGFYEKVPPLTFVRGLEEQVSKRGLIHDSQKMWQEGWCDIHLMWYSHKCDNHTWYVKCKAKPWMKRQNTRYPGERGSARSDQLGWETLQSVQPCLLYP